MLNNLLGQNSYVYFTDDNQRFRHTVDKADIGTIAAKGQFVPHLTSSFAPQRRSAHVSFLLPSVDERSKGKG